METIQLIVNGEARPVRGDPDTPLLWVLRDHLSLTGTKYSCGIGICGACTVYVDGAPRRSCQVKVSEASGKAITTIEGLSPNGSHPLQVAWIEENVSQCGYCQPGQIMTAAALLAENPSPSEADIDQAMSSVLCRCGSYQRIKRAIRRAIATEG